MLPVLQYIQIWKISENFDGASQGFMHEELFIFHVQFF